MNLLVVHDAEGKQILKKKLKQPNEEIDCTKWANGHYFITVYTNKKVYQTQQFSKQ